jgi:hypothetical protein
MKLTKTLPIFPVTWKTHHSTKDVGKRKASAKYFVWDCHVLLRAWSVKTKLRLVKVRTKDICVHLVECHITIVESTFLSYAIYKESLETGQNFGHKH